MLRVEAAGAPGLPGLEVALAVAPGECLALAGPSGAGKTTVLRIAAGLGRPDHGCVSCGDAVWLDTRRGVDVPPERRSCGVVFQDYALFPHLSAWRNVAYALPRRDRRRRALELLDRLGLAGRAGALPRDLSGGERQRVALARALAREPRTLLLDEPLSALDQASRAGATRELRRVLRETGVPAVLVTHDFMEAAQLGDRVAVLDRGRIVQEGAAGDLAARPRSAFVAGFAGAVVLTGTAHRGADGLTEVTLDGGTGTVASLDPAQGRVAVTVFPWEVALEPAAAARAGSPRNRIPVEVVAVTQLGDRVRVALQAGQPLSAEITLAAARELGLIPGLRLTATWKAATTRVVPV